MKTFLKYPGGKTKEIPVIKENLPKEIKRYFEPFVGGGSVYLNLSICNSYINDFSEDLINVYKNIKDQNLKFKEYLLDFDYIWKSLENDNFNINFFDKYAYIDKEKFVIYFKKALDRKNKTVNKIFEDNGSYITRDNGDLNLTSRKTSFYMIIRDLYNAPNTEKDLKTACYYFLREYCYSSMFRYSKDGNFNVPYGGISYNKKSITQKINYMYSEEMHEYIKNTKIFNLDFEIFLNNFELDDGDFIFLDPPYDSNFSTYDNKIFDRKEQIRLNKFLNNTKAKWMLVIKKTDFIYDLYKDFYIYEYENNYAVSFKNRNDRKVEHLLITNYEIEVKTNELVVENKTKKYYKNCRLV